MSNSTTNPQSQQAQNHLTCATCKEKIDDPLWKGAVTWVVEFREGYVYHSGFRVTHRLPGCIHSIEHNENSVIHWLPVTDFFIENEVDFSVFFNPRLDEFGYLIDDGREYGSESMESTYYLLCWALEGYQPKPMKPAQRRKYWGAKHGYVYLIQSASGHFKIGRTGNPDDRMKTFSVKLPFEVEYLCVIKTDDMYALEYELHERFADKHVNGEWFDLSGDDVDYIKGLSK